MSNIKYRADIDGLRALAVLMVIIFHMNADWLPGGFIGVDIFFVISGYIITTVIYPQVLAKEFSFNLFYIKRIKRILPLFYLVAFTSLALAYWLYTPDDLVGVADSLRYASAFIANIYFEKHSGYFAPASETLPLLHTWSLSIEEQFYFIWPVVLILTANYLKPRFFGLVMSSGLIGLIIYSDLQAQQGGSAGYYLIQSRAFELLVGGLLAIVLYQARHNITGHNMTYLNHTRRLSQLILNKHASLIFGISGMLSILCLSIFLNENDPFPGINALLVTLACALIILSGASKPNLVSRALSLRPMVLLGRLSYSLYLWHWPVLAFHRYYYTSFTVMDTMICAVITLALSLMSWQWVENRLRHLQIGNRWVYLFYLILPIAVSVTVAKHIASKNGYPARFSESVQEIFNQSTYTFDQEKPQRPQVVDAGPFEPFIIGDSRQPISAYIWGDSHAAHFRSFVDVLGKQEGFSALYGGIGGCPPVLGSDLIKQGHPDLMCSQRNEAIARQLAQLKPKRVYLAGRWAMYTETTRSLGEKGKRVYLGDQGDYTESVDNSRRAFNAGLERTIRHLIEVGIEPVLFEQVPSYPFNPSNCLVKQATYSGMKDQSCDLPLLAMQERHTYANNLIYAMAKKYPQVHVIPIVALVCDEQSCKSQLDNTPLYNDNDHLNYQGARVLAERWLAQK